MSDRETHYRRLEKLYLDAPTNAYYRPMIRVADSSAEIAIEARRDFHHAANAVHGSVYFKLLDDAAFFAANSVVDDVLVLTFDFSIHLLRPVSEGTMTARGRVLHAGKRTIVAEAQLFDALEQLIAHGVGSYVRSRIPLP